MAALAAAGKEQQFTTASGLVRTVFKSHLRFLFFILLFVLFLFVSSVSRLEIHPNLPFIAFGRLRAAITLADTTFLCLVFFPFLPFFIQ